MNFEISKGEDGAIGGIFDYNFYSLEVLRNAIIDFGECSEVKIFYEEDCVKIFFKSKDKELKSQEIFYEFCNYVLGSMKGDINGRL